jgi:membrane protease YdiL (CAAX protease family)
VFALVFPFLIGAIAYDAAWATGLVGLRVIPLGIWAVLIIAMLSLNVVVSTGEELGWRGYMLDRMVEAGVPRPILASSVIWGVWHVPLFLWGGLQHMAAGLRVQSPTRFGDTYQING